jgi:uncharacterized protein with HEPN domain
MIAYANKVLEYCVGVSESDFAADNKLTDACAMNLIQIGELARLLDDDFIECHQDIPFRQIRGMRNRLVHDYEGLNFVQIWATISLDLPELVRQLEDL